MSDTPLVEVAGTSRRREATRQKLLDAAALVFAEVGLDAASVEAICERAGFTRGAFYSNFETKDELMLALTERVAGEKIDEVAERVALLQERGEDLEPGALVRQLLDVAFDKKQGILLTSEIRTRAMRDQRLAETYIAWQTGMVERVGSFIDELARSYGFRLRLPVVGVRRHHPADLGRHVGLRHHDRPRCRRAAAARQRAHRAALDGPGRPALTPASSSRRHPAPSTS